MLEDLRSVTMPSPFALAAPLALILPLLGQGLAFVQGGDAADPAGERSAPPAKRRKPSCRVAHTPNGSPKPCFFYVMMASGRKPRSASLQNRRSFSPSSL